MGDNEDAVKWTVRRTMAGVWVVFGSTPIFTSRHKKKVENWLALHGAARPDELERLFQDADEKGEGAITVPSVSPSSS